jgi:hypothetical protein
MKSWSGEEWVVTDDHGRKEDDDKLEPAAPQALVFIALSDLDQGNGLFMELKAGESFCIDSRAQLVYPAVGGGLGIMFWLRV